MKKIEERYPDFQKSVEVLKNALNVSNISALTETFDNLENDKIKVEEDAPDKKTIKKLTNIYNKLDYDKLDNKLKSEIFSLLTLKAINDDRRNYTQMPTPQIISTIIALIWNKLISADEMENVLDPAIGTGGLLFAVIKQLMQENHSKNNYKLFGIDNDEVLLDLADVRAHLEDIDIDLFRQDALDPWLVTTPNIVISDLPVGYYPLDNNAKRFENNETEGHSFSHLLFIEQIVNNLAKNGFAFLVVPRLLFTSKNASVFMNWLSKKVNIKMVVELPEEMFASPTQQKSILVFQNHGNLSKSGEVLVAKLASLENPKSLIEFNTRLNEWIKKGNR